MKDFIFKIRMLLWFLSNGFEDWKREIWKRDLDGLYCCDGRECACGGETVRDTWEMVSEEQGA